MQNINIIYCIIFFKNIILVIILSWILLIYKIYKLIISIILKNTKLVKTETVIALFKKNLQYVYTYILWILVITMILGYVTFIRYNTLLS